MDWKELAINIAKDGKNSGEITRILQKMGFFRGEDFAQCYERVRKYVRKHGGGKNPIWKNEVPAVIENKTKEKHLKFALIGDTHIGNKCVQLTHLNTFYSICQEQGVTDVYHCGDITDGYQMRASQEYELYTHGVDEVIDSIVKYYPKIDGITTHFITGNHDASIYKNSGIDIGKYIVQQRTDMKYLGRDCARLNISDKCSIELRHPWDGSSYAISSKSQKIIDNIEDRPTILAIGHYHKAEYLYYKNVHAFQVGCFESRTPFEIGKNILVSVGGWIVDVTFTEDGDIKTISPQFIPFNNTINNDFTSYCNVFV